ncbi:MAG: isoprenyl transferase [Firmicutes bacterium]|nr:isoprenyl transferase [Bacillota bacterium]
MKESNRRETKLARLISPQKLPNHVAIIMDGNGRWANKRGLPRIAGHRAGMNTLKEIITCAHDLGINVLTLFAFSTENWKRPRWEVDFLMRLPQEYLQKELQSLMEKNIVIKTMGELKQLPRITKNTVREALQKTKNNSGMILNFALNYGGRHEILNAVKAISEKVKRGILKTEEINEDLFDGHLYTKDLPQLDLLIRPSGELRISNFLLWQLAYAELWFTEIFWPDFKKEHFLEAILDYQERERRFGGIHKL